MLMAPSPAAGQFNPISTTLAEYNGSQCGFCSSGFVMNMYRYVCYGELVEGVVD
jgi:xanthine dehydrogenase iron-sulfur cluster and FAD-binding subunit A